MQQLFNRRSSCWNLLNSANIALLPKKEGASQVGDYRPISLMHSIAKIFGKVLANRLAPHLERLVSHSQSAFIKGRCIQDNFQYVHGAVQHFHRSKTPMLLVKQCTLGISVRNNGTPWIQPAMERHNCLNMVHHKLQGFTKWGTWSPNPTSPGTQAGRPTLADALYPCYGPNSTATSSSNTTGTSHAYCCKSN